MSQEQRACRALLGAILHRTLRDLQAPGQGQRVARRRDAAIAWVVDPDAAPFSFVWVCRELGTDPVRQRRRFLLAIGQPPNRRRRQAGTRVLERRTR